MAVENAPLLAFNRGIVSPLALARVDIKRLSLSAQIQENWMPRVLGSMSLRQGLGYIANTYNNSAARYLPFLFSLSDTALIELTDSVMRVLVNEVPVTRPSVATSGANGTFISGLSGWADLSDVGGAVTWVSAGNVSFQGDGTNAAKLGQTINVAPADVGKMHALRIQIAQGDGIHVRVGLVVDGANYVKDTQLLPGTHSLAFTPTTSSFVVTLYDRESYVSILNNCTVEPAGVMLLPTVWTATDLDNVRFDQSADVLFLACKNRPPQRIERHGTYSWSVVEYISEDGPFGVVNLTTTTLAPSALQGSVSLTASKPLFDSGFVDRLVAITSVGQTVVASFSAANVFSNPIQVTGLTAKRGFGIIISGTFSATVTLQQSIGAPGAWTDVQSWTIPVSTSYNDNLDNQIIFYRLGIKVGNYTSGTANVQLTYAGGSLTGYARITGLAVGLLSPLAPATVACGVNPRGIAIAPSGTSVYVANWNDSTLSQYSRAAGGGLTPLAPATVATGTGCVGVAVSPDGTSVYVCNNSSLSVSQYSRAPGGTLTPLAPATVSTGGGAWGVAVSPDGTSVYVTNYSGSWSVAQFSRAPGGTLTPLSPATVLTGNNPIAVVVSPDGNSVYVLNQSSNSISQFSRAPGGTLTPLAPATIATGNSPQGIAISPDGTSVYVANATGNTVSQYSRAVSGLLTPLAPATVPSSGSPSGVAVSSDGASVYAYNASGNTISQYSRAAGGALAPLIPATVATGSNPQGIAVSPDATSAYVVNFLGNTISQYGSSNGSLTAFASVTQPFGAITASSTWYLGDWAPGVGYPTATVLHQERLWWAGKGKIWGSISGSYISNDPAQVGDAGPINVTFGSGMVDNINWLLSGSLFLIGAESSEHVARSDALDGPLTPTAFNLRAVTTKGSTNISPLRIDQSMLFVSRTGSRVYELVSDAMSTAYNLYNAQDVTVIAPEVCNPKIVRAAVQRNVDTRVHFVLSDGTVAVLVYDKAEDVRGWIKITTQGSVEDVVVLPASTGQHEDSVYYVVKRTIGGSTVRFLEKFSSESETTGAPVAKLADAHTYYSGAATTTITGLSYLEGQTVVCWGWNTITPFTVTKPDGTIGTVGKDFGTFVVAGGSITLPQAVTDACVGLGYQAKFQSTKLAYASQIGTALNQRKRIPHLGLILNNTHAHGLQFGPDFTRLDDLPGEEAGVAVDANDVWTSYDFDAVPFNGTYHTDSRLCLVANAPRPCTVLAATVTVETNEKS